MRPLCQSSPSMVALFTTESTEAWRECKLICQRCPELTDCRERTLRQEANGLPVHGVAGGLSPLERPNAPRPEWARRGARNNVPAPGPKWANQYTGREQPCGTYAAAARHEKAREPLCEPCLTARRAYVATTRRDRMARQRAS